MSKNIYRVNKKSDLDEIMKNNFLKPICIIFVSKSMDKKLYDDIATSIKSMSKQLTYSMILIIDFDDFIDNMNFFTTIKENVPHFIAYFKGKQIANCNDKDNFIPLIVGLMDQIHSSYVTRLMNAFNQQTEKNNLETTTNIIDRPDDKQNKQNEEIENNQNIQPNIHTNTQTNTQPNTQPNTQTNTQTNTQSNTQSNTQPKTSKKKANKQVTESEDESDESDDSDDSEEGEDEEDKVDEEDEEDEEDEDEDIVKTNVKNKKEIVQDDNTTENIRLKKEKLKELKKLKEMLNK
jgi:hypothetical protein